MRYQSIKKYDVANGEGLRTSIFFTGCTLHCKDCFNYEIWDFNSGKEFDSKVQDKVIELLKDQHCDGLSILGGEPTDQGDELVEFLSKVRREIPDKSIWLWSGRTMGQLRNSSKKKFLDVIDVLVDGPFESDKKDLNLKFRGSSNQHIWEKKDNLWVLKE